jgi:hypothetical protein
MAELELNPPDQWLVILEMSFHEILVSLRPSDSHYGLATLRGVAADISITVEAGRRREQEQGRIGVLDGYGIGIR